MNADRLLAHYAKIADAPDAISRLRRFILDLAVRGALVLQDPSDEPASALLKRIATEKERLIRAGKIKVRNVADRANGETVVFDCPAGWALTELGEVSLKITDGAHKTPTYVEKGVPFISVKDFSGGKLNFSNTRFIPEDEHQVLYQRCDPRRGDILIGRIGTLGKAVLVDTDVEFSLFVSVGLIRFDHECLNPAFFRLLLNSPFVEAEFDRIKIGGGTHTNKLNLGDLYTIALPIPPLAEQSRIVAKVDELMALCDRLEAARATREAVRDRLAAASLARLNVPDPETFHVDALFALEALSAFTTRPDQIRQLRQTILNLAVRGKLGLQDPNDEPASELLKRIAVERGELVKKKEIRREDPLDPIQSAGMPFDVAAGWVWSRIGEAVLFTQYGTSQKSNPSEKGVPVLTMGNVQDGLVVWSNEKRIPETSEDLPALYLRKFDLLYNRTNSAELVGKTGIYLGDDGVRTFASYLIRLRPSLLSSNPKYVNLAMNAPEFRETQIVPLIKKQTGQANVNGTALKNMLIPLPPLAEQHRIVAKVDTLMALCDRLEASLTASAVTRRRLLDALLAEALTPTEDREMEAAE